MNVKTIFQKYMVGDNIVTPTITKYGSKKLEKCTILYEYSEGIGMSDQYLYGLTILILEDNKVQQIDLGRLYASTEERQKYLNSINQQKVDNALRFGKTLTL